MAKEFNYEFYVKNLPDAYQKSDISNNNRILWLERELMRAMQQDIDELAWLLDNMEEIYGGTLDLYGEIYGIPRNGLEDEQYRIVLMLKIAQNRTGSDHTSIVKALEAALNIPAENFKLQDAEKSGNVDIDMLPYTIFQEVGIKPKQVYDIIRSFLGVGIGIGTFQVLHEVPDNNLKIATAIVQGESYALEIKPLVFEELEASLIPAVAIVHSEFNEVEVI